MKNIFLFLFFSTSFSLASNWNINASVISSPSKGIIGIERYFIDNHFSLATNFMYFSDEYLEFGLDTKWHILGFNGFYLFHTSSWIHGSGSIWDKKKSDWIDRSENNYWRLIFGLGIQYAFFKHFGIYGDAGYEFYAGNGGYYSYFDGEWGKLNNDKIKFPISIGLMFPF
jgi:hypothetical protein